MKQLKAHRGAVARADRRPRSSRRSNSPTRCYIAAQARERLGFVMPGDIPYQVQLPRERGCAERTRQRSRRQRRSDEPWYTSLWHTIADAPHGVSPTIAPDCASPPAAPRHRSCPVRRLPVVERCGSRRRRAAARPRARGVLEIAYRCPNGEPGVVRTAPRLPDGTPFPTLYYLTHPVLTAAASRLESVGPDARDDRTAATGSAAGRRLPPRRTSPTWPSATRSSHWARRSPVAACPSG